MADNVYKSRDIWRAAFKSALPVMCGYVPLAMAFGLLMNYAGYGALDSGAMSLIVYAGSSQFMAARMLASGAAPMPTKAAKAEMIIRIGNVTPRPVSASAPVPGMLPI